MGTGPDIAGSITSGLKKGAGCGICGGDHTKPKKGLDLDAIYKADNYLRWYRLFTYGFEFNSRASKKEGDSTGSLKMWLPLQPNNLTITTHFATNIVTTLYGVVEEHSDIRYYDIVIQGTTGYQPKYVYPENYPVPAGTEKGPQHMGRKWFVDKPFVPDKLSKTGFAQQTVGIINAVASKVSAVMSKDSPDEVNGLDPTVSGYVAFHNLYRLFHLYKRDAAGSSGNTKTKHTVHPLQFLNYKDKLRYDVVPRSFTLTRSAESPMLYNYSIVLRAYNMRGVDLPKIIPGNRLAALGLAGEESSAFNQVSKLSSVASTVIGGLKAGRSVLGR